jgi:hypothetical protein
MATSAGGGSFDLKLCEDDPLSVVLTISLPAVLSETPNKPRVAVDGSAVVPSSDESIVHRRPEGLKICAIDDSQVRNMLERVR